MFRELLRKNKRLSTEECIQVLNSQTRGVLSVQGDDHIREEIKRGTEPCCCALPRSISAESWSTSARIIVDR